MTSPPDDTTTDASAIIAALRAERDSALSEKTALAETLAARTAELAKRNAEYSERIEHQAGTVGDNEALTVENQELRAAQAAGLEVLQAMIASPSDTQPVFDLIARQAADLCMVPGATVAMFDGTMLHLATQNGLDPAYASVHATEFPRPVGPDSLMGRTILSRRVEQIEDFDTDPAYGMTRRPGNWSAMAVPLLRYGAPLGVIAVARPAIGRFPDNQVKLLQTFAEQAVIAITSAETYRALQTRTSDLQESLEYQAATSDVLKVISRSSYDLKAVLQALLDTAARLCAADFGALMIRDGDVFRTSAIIPISPAHEAFVRRKVFVPSPHGSVVERTAFARQITHTEDIATLSDYVTSGRGFVVSGTALGVPLFLEGDVVGVFTLHRQRTEPFTDAQIELVSTFADQAAIAIENTRLLTEQREALERQTALAEVLAVINANPGELGPVFDMILEKAHRLCDIGMGALLTCEAGQLRAVVTRGYSPEADAHARRLRPIPLNLAARAKSGAVFHVPDVSRDDSPLSAHDFGRTFIALTGARTYLVVPLSKEGALLGTITAVRREVRPFSERQITLLQNFAAQAVIAMDNARLITEQREALEQQTATAEVLQVINASPGDLSPVFATILDKAMRFCDAAFGGLFTYDGERFHTVASLGTPPALTEFRTRNPPSPLPGSTAARLLETRRTHHILDRAQEPDYLAGEPGARAMVELGGARSMLNVPLNKDDNLLGYISIYRQEVRPFSDKQIALLESFATQAVIAMENARLITETREALEQQTATAEVLQVINASPGNLAPVFDAMLEKAMRLSGAAYGVLRSYDGEHLHMLASRGVPTEYAEFLARSGGPGTPGDSPIPQTAPMQALETRRPAQRLDVRESIGYTSGIPGTRAIADLGGARTCLHVPLVKDQVAVGLLTFYRQEVRAFSDKQIALLQNFAAQAVIAMENARLMTEQREALEQQTATAEVLQVINASPGNLQPVFDIILDKAMWLCGAAFGRLSTWDGKYAHTVAMRGFPPALSDKFAARGPSSEISPAIARLYKTKRPTQVPDVLAGEGYRNNHPDPRALADLGGVRTFLAVPLRKDDVMLGHIAVYRQEVRVFSDKEIALLENFAAQAVIAMENARLLNEVRERTEALAQRNSEFGERIEQQSATIDVLKVMSSTPDDTQPVFELIVRRAQELCKGVGASLIELEGNLVHFRATHSPASHSNDPAAVEAWKALFPMVPTLEWLSCRAILEKREVHIRDVQTDPGLSDIVRATNSDIRSHLTVPLMRDGQAIGSISLRGKEPGGFTDSQVALLRTFAEQAVIAIGSVANFRALRERTAELAQRQEELRVTFENMGDGVAMFDETQHLVAWNRKFQHILDVPDDIIGRRQTFSEYVHYLAERGEYDPEAHPEEHVRGLIEQAGQSRTDERTRPDGRVIEIRHNPVAGGGFVLIYADITERKRSEAEIRAARDAAEEASRTIEAAYRELKTAQANLIQAEKMASLGQLTAGIAHEIKNPLNFVNNFSALSTELIDELRDVLAPEPLGETARTEVDDLTALLKGNLEKVVQHGQRADGIVRSMLDHSRGSSGERRMVDLNALIDEALNLAYHGARAQDQSFNITLERDFGEGIAPIEVNPQDITRVFLNLFSNGFYATTRRARDGADAGFVPSLKVTTRDAGEVVEIRVRDNGTGIPADIRDKLFQPFFTTKPTGEGTGLGLSITYDIVTQQHGGSIGVDSKLGEYSEFTIRLPRNP